MPGISIVKATVFTKIKGYCSQYQAVYNKLVELNDVPDTLIAKEQNKMVRQEVAYVGWADVYDDLLVLAQQTNNGGGALINWINPGTFDATHVPNGGALTFGSLEGLTGDGTAYLNTNYNPNTDKINISQNSTAVLLYLRTNIAEAGYDFGCNDGTNFLRSSGRTATDTLAYWINSGNISAVGVMDLGGMNVMQREDASYQDYWLNKVRIEHESDASGGIPNQDMFVLGQNNNGAPANGSSDQVSVFAITKALTQSKIENATDIIEAYMDYNEKGVIS